MIQCKRVYETASAEDGVRVLVDRLWPRNCRKTLVYSAKSTVENNAVVLAQWLEDEVEKRAEGSSSVCYLSEFPEL